MRQVLRWFLKQLEVGQHNLDTGKVLVSGPDFKSVECAECDDDHVRKWNREASATKCSKIVADCVPDGVCNEALAEDHRAK